MFFCASKAISTPDNTMKKTAVMKDQRNGTRNTLFFMTRAVSMNSSQPTFHSERMAVELKTKDKVVYFATET